MSQAKPGALSTRGNSNAVPFTALGFLIVPFVAAMALAVILEPHPSSGAADSAIDPLLAPSLIEFRRDERLGAAPERPAARAEPSSAAPTATCCSRRA